MSFNILQSQGPFKNCLILLFWGIKNFTNFFTGTRIFTDGMPVYRWYGKFSKLATLLGSQFLLPQRANNGKGEFSQLQIWMRQRGFSAWGIQTGPLAAL